MSLFAKKNNNNTAIKTLIAHGTVVRGDIVFNDGLRIDGEVRGNIFSESENNSLLVISESAYIEGKIHGTYVIVGGNVKGPIHASQLLELQPKAQIQGDVEYATLEIHQGASVMGQFKHADPNKPPLRLEAPADSEETSDPAS